MNICFYLLLILFYGKAFECFRVVVGHRPGAGERTQAYRETYMIMGEMTIPLDSTNSVLVSDATGTIVPGKVIILLLSSLTTRCRHAILLVAFLHAHSLPDRGGLRPGAADGA